MDIWLHGRKIAVQEHEKASPEVLRLICKLRWMGMEVEAEQVQMKLHQATPTGGVITATHETD